MLFKLSGPTLLLKLEHLLIVLEKHWNVLSCFRTCESDAEIVIAFEED